MLLLDGEGITGEARHLPPFFSHSCEITYSKRERVGSVDEIEHPAIREAMKFLDMREMTLTYDADLPARSGLGTSSSLKRHPKRGLCDDHFSFPFYLVRNCSPRQTRCRQ